MKRNLYLLILVLSLTACANLSPIKPEQKSNIHNVAIVSILGDELKFTKVGLTVFSNDNFDRDTTNWNLDVEAQKSIMNELQSSSPDIKVVQVPFNREALFKIYKSPNSWGEYASLERIEPELKNALAANPVDAVILVHKQRGEDAIGMTSIFLEGYGIYYRALPFVDPVLKPYVYFSIVVLDGKTLKPLTSRYVRGISTEYGKTKISWDDQIKSNLSEQLIADFQASIKSVIKNNLHTSLNEMGF
jgi:hypothetical protein